MRASCLLAPILETGFCGSGISKTSPTSNCAADGNDWLRLGYTYGATRNNGNMFGQTIARSQPSQTAFNATQTYTYDGSADSASAVNGFNRLTQISEGGVSLEEYDFDAVGNRWLDTRSTSLPGGASLPPEYLLRPTGTPKGTWNPFNGQNRVGTWQTATGYDDAGNLLSIVGDGRTFEYDAENRQTKATITASGGQTTYFYDGDGRRVKKVAPDGSFVKTTVFVYDGSGQLVQERTSTTNPTPPPPADTGTRFVSVDHLGSTRLEMDVAGNPAKCYDYLPFGEGLTLNRTMACYGSGTAGANHNPDFTGGNRGRTPPEI